MVYLYGLVPARYLNPEWAAQVGFPHSYWPFLTMMFLHGGWIHIIGNMWFLGIFGDNVEDRMGPIRFVGFYLLCGIAAGFVHIITNPQSTVPALGASGAIAGVMAAYVVLYPRARILAVFPIVIYPLFFEVPAVLYIGVWFLLPFLGEPRPSSPEATKVPLSFQRGGRISVGNRDYHQLSHFEIGGGKRISRHLSNFQPEIDQG